MTGTSSIYQRGYEDGFKGLGSHCEGYRRELLYQCVAGYDEGCHHRKVDEEQRNRREMRRNNQELSRQDS